jgi:hypothetical protein
MSSEYFGSWVVDPLQDTCSFSCSINIVEFKSSPLTSAQSLLSGLASCTILWWWLIVGAHVSSSTFYDPIRKIPALRDLLLKFVSEPRRPTFDSSLCI